MPQPNMLLVSCVSNRLIEEELNYDTSSLVDEHKRLFVRLNAEQVIIYKSIMNSISIGDGGLFFINGHGGIGKTYLYNTILSGIRSQGKIALAVASSGIAALLLPGGRTAHSRFRIPIIIDDDATCEIKKKTHLAELLERTSLIVGEEAPMAHRNCFEALDRSLRDILETDEQDSRNRIFGGKVVVLGGDFRQILPVVRKGRREDIVNSTINKSYLWQYCRVFQLHRNMRFLQNNISVREKILIQEFGDWILKIGEGRMSQIGDDDLITTPDDLLIHGGKHSIQAIVASTYPDLQRNFKKPSYLKERAILAPTNEIVKKVNDYIGSLIDGEETIYLSADSICKSTINVNDESLLYPTEFLNSLKAPGLPDHKLRLKVGLPVILLRNLKQSAELCNGTRLVITRLARWIIEAEIITGNNFGALVNIPRIALTPSV